MPSVSKAQQSFMGMVHAAQQGAKPASPKVAKAAKSMTKKAAHDFAATKRRGLPQHVSEEVFDQGKGHQRGTTWEADSSEEQWRYGAKNMSGATRYFPDKQAAARFSKKTGDTRYHQEGKLVKKENIHEEPVKSTCPSCGNKWAVDLGKDGPHQFYGCLKCDKTYIPNAGVKTEGKLMKEDRYNSGPFDSPKDTYQRGTQLSRKSLSSNDAMRSDDRDDMGRRRPDAKDLSNHMQMIEAYNEYGKALKRENRMKEIADKLVSIAETAEMVTMNEADDWFDKHTVSRNMKEMKRYASDFSKLSEEADALNERMTALYDDMGNVLNRYFEIRTPHQDQAPEQDQEQDVEMTSEGKYPNIKEASLSKPYKCQECGKRLSQKAAERAMYGDHGCPGCGGSDIDISDELGEIKDTDWMTTTDRDLGKDSRDAEDFQDRKRGHLQGFTKNDQDLDEYEDMSPGGQEERLRQIMLKKNNQKKDEGGNPELEKFDDSDPEYNDTDGPEESLDMDEMAMKKYSERVNANAHIKHLKDKIAKQSQIKTEGPDDDMAVARAQLARAQKRVSQNLSPKQRLAAANQVKSASKRIAASQERSSRDAEEGGKRVSEIGMAQQWSSLDQRLGSRNLAQTIDDENSGFVVKHPGEADNIVRKGRVRMNEVGIAPPESSAHEKPMDDEDASQEIMKAPKMSPLRKYVHDIRARMKENKKVRLKETIKGGGIKCPRCGGKKAPGGIVCAKCNNAISTKTEGVSIARMQKLAGIKRENAMSTTRDVPAEKLTKAEYDKNPAGSKVTVRGKKSVIRPGGGWAASNMKGAAYAQPVEIIPED